MSEEADQLVEAFDDAVVLTATTDVMDREDFKVAHDKWSASRAALLAYIERIERERDEARANYAFMVEKAAQREPTLDGYRELGAKCAQLEQKLDEARAENARLQAIVDEQAEDEGLWFVAETAPEAYLQQELRRLHAAIDAARKP